MKLILVESQASDRYEKEFTDIPKDIFDKICALDPNSIFNGDELMRIGANALQLLIPCYRKGEDFLDKSDLVKSSLTKYLASRKDYPVEFRNLGNFSSVEDFIKFVQDPSSLSTDDLAVKKEETKLDQIYNKYYSDFKDRDIFDTIIKLDPTTTEDKIGEIAKNLLLPKYRKGETDFIDNKDLSVAISNFFKNKKYYDDEHKKIETYSSVDEFIKYNLNRIIEDSTTTSKLKSYGEDSPFGQYNLIASTDDYDVYQPLTRQANSVIANGGWDERRGDGMYWCTSSLETGNYWNQYVTTPGYNLYCFIKRGDESNRSLNFQLDVNPRENIVHEFLNGNDQHQFNTDKHKDFEIFLKNNPKVFLAIKDKPVFKDINVIKKLELEYTFSEEPLIINSYKDFKDLFGEHYTTLYNSVVEIQINNIESIPAKIFSNFIKLKKVTINSGVKIIEAQAFKSCAVLEEVNLNEGLEVIGFEAFASCPNLKQIELPSTLKEIKFGAFKNDNQLKIILYKKYYLNDPDKKLIVDQKETDWYKSHFRLA